MSTPWKQDEHGQRYIERNGLVAYPCGGGYWYAGIPNGELVATWISADEARNLLRLPINKAAA